MRIKKINLTLTTTLIVFTILISSSVVLAQDPGQAVKEGLNKTAEQAGIKDPSTSITDPSGTLATIFGRTANYIFGPVAIIFFTIILIGGYKWMIARGNEEKIEKAKKFILNGVWGLIVIFFSWTIVIVILGALNKATNSG